MKKKEITHATKYQKTNIKKINQKPEANCADLNKSVDSQNGQVRIALSIIHDIEVHQLLELEILRVHALDHIGEEHGHVLSDRHGGDHLLHAILLLVLLGAVELLLEFVDLA